MGGFTMETLKKYAGYVFYFLFFAFFLAGTLTIVRTVAEAMASITGRF
jgi:hypothetical protein